VLVDKLNKGPEVFFFFWKSAICAKKNPKEKHMLRKVKNWIQSNVT